MVLVCFGPLSCLFLGMVGLDPLPSPRFQTGSSSVEPSAECTMMEMHLPVAGVRRYSELAPSRCHSVLWRRPELQKRVCVCVLLKGPKKRCYGATWSCFLWYNISQGSLSWNNVSTLCMLPTPLLHTGTPSHLLVSLLISAPRAVCIARTGKGMCLSAQLCTTKMWTL